MGCCCNLVGAFRLCGRPSQGAAVVDQDIAFAGFRMSMTVVSDAKRWENLTHDAAGELIC